MSGLTVLPGPLHRLALLLRGLAVTLWPVLARFPVPVVVAVLVLLAMGEAGRARAVLFAGCACVGTGALGGLGLQVLLMRVLWEGLLTPRPPSAAALNYEAVWACVVAYLRSRLPSAELTWLDDLHPFDARQCYPWGRGGLWQRADYDRRLQVVVGLRLLARDSRDWHRRYEERGELLDAALCAVLGRAAMVALVWEPDESAG